MKRPFWLRNWLERHQTPLSFWLHVVGIPLAVASVPVCVVGVLAGSSAWIGSAGGLLFVGYLLQYVGHRHEGNDVGELIPIKKLLGLPYVAVSPRFAARPNESAASTGPTGGGSTSIAQRGNS